MYENSKSKAIKSWAEFKYNTETSAEVRDLSIAFNKQFVTQKGAHLYTDGIIEINKEDKFNSLIVSGYNYVLLCLYGKQFSNCKGPRILIYLNSTSNWTVAKIKNEIREDMKTYTNKN